VATALLARPRPGILLPPFPGTVVGSSSAWKNTPGGERLATAAPPGVGADGVWIEFYAAVFNAAEAAGHVYPRGTAPYGNWRVVIDRGAYRATLADGHPIFAQWQHQPGAFGNTHDGTLRLTEDHHGLRAQLWVPHGAAWEARARGASGGSCGYSVPDWYDEPRRADGYAYRHFARIALDEVSLVGGWGPVFKATLGTVHVLDDPRIEAQRRAEHLERLRQL
jgi:phage head maturation protease